MARVVLAQAFVLAFCGVAFAAVPATQEVISVTVYFESYCPDSVKFLTTQLYPTFLTPLASHMNVTLVPYGKATTIKSESGEYTFSCHHGEKECRGNKVIACVLKDKETMFAEQFKFINCTSAMIAANTKMEEYPIEKCASMSSVIKADAVTACASGSMGSEYLAEYGNKTSELSPPLSSVPSVVFNEKFSETESKLAVSDFRKTLCSKISGTKPAECTKNSAALTQVALLPVIAALAIVSRV